MSKESFPIHVSDLEGVEYAECLPCGASDCAAIHVEHLSLSYGNDKAFSDVSITLPPCNISAIIGPSGCGKTSFLHCLNRLTDLIPEARVSGRVNIGATDVFAKSCDVISLRKRVGMIFQRPVPFPFSIRKNFHLALKEHGVKSKQDREARMEGALVDVGLWREVKDRLNMNATRLSGGQQQRLCIARALSLQPEVLLLDEPCSALDPISSGVVEELIASLRGRYTIVLVTHNLQQAQRLADYAGLFWTEGHTGKLIEHGTVDEIFENPSHKITQDYMSGITG